MASASSSSAFAFPGNNPAASASTSKSNPVSKTATSKQPLKSMSVAKGKQKEQTKLFTPMQGAQAKGKGLFVDLSVEDEEEDSDVSMDWQGDSRFTKYGEDNFERTQKKRGAACILDNPELIMMHALARGDSIPGTRNYLMKAMCGYFESNDEDDVLEPASEKDKERKKLKPWQKDVDPQGRPWASGHWGFGNDSTSFGTD